MRGGHEPELERSPRVLVDGELEPGRAAGIEERDEPDRAAADTRAAKGRCAGGRCSPERRGFLKRRGLRDLPMLAGVTVPAAGADDDRLRAPDDLVGGAIRGDDLPPVADDRAGARC